MTEQRFHRPVAVARRLRVVHAGLIAVAAAAGLAACGPGKATPVTPAAPAAPPTPSAQSVTVQVTPSAQLLATGGVHQFAAAVTGTEDTRVTWSVAETAGGTVDTSGRYTAPGNAGSYHVRATSVADTRAFGEAVVSVAVPTPVSVTVSPASGAVDACLTLSLSAAVANATNTAVTWTVQEGAAGGTVSASGVYTAPATPGTYHVVATSVQDGTRTASAVITVSEHVLSVAVSPKTVTLQPGQTQLFTATITTTCGTTAATSTVTAPL